MNLTGRSETGCRQQNEDSFFIVNGPSSVYAAVSDGMGGHAAGEVASSIAVCTLKQVLSEAETIDESVIHRAFMQANDQVLNAASSDPSRYGMGATLVCVVLFPDSFLAANVGDSRLYLIHDSSVVQISHDHSFVAELVRRNIITQEEARVHPRRNLITRAIGADTTVKVDLFSREWEHEDILLLCSDGLSGSVSEQEIVDILSCSKSLDAACSSLIELALKNGSTDNITVVLAQNAEAQK